MESKISLLRKIEHELSGKLDAKNLSTVLSTVSDQLALFDIQQTQPGQETDEMLDTFLSAKAIEGRSPLTLQRYKGTIRQLMKAVNVTTREVTVYHIRKFLSEQKERGLADRTLEGIRQIYCGYFNWLQREGLIQANPAANLGAIRCEKKLVEAFTDVEIEQIKDACRDIREKAMVLFLLSTGCRISEVTGLNKANVDLRLMTCKVHGKGNKERYVYLDSVAAMVLRGYLETRQDSCEALFTNRYGKRIDPCGVRWILNQISARSGVEHVHPHKFRRTCATKLIARGMPIQNVSKILGHDKIETTMRYVRLDDSAVQSSYRTCA